MEKIDLAWARVHLTGFAKMEEAALAVKASEDEYKKLLKKEEKKENLLVVVK